MAVTGDESPAPFCASLSGFGYVGKDLLLVRAAQPSPMAVAKPNGMPYHAMPPKRYAFMAVSGREAMALCQ